MVLNDSIIFGNARDEFKYNTLSLEQFSPQIEPTYYNKTWEDIVVMTRAAARRKTRLLLKEQEEMLSESFTLNTVTAQSSGEENSLFSSTLLAQQPHSASTTVAKDIVTGVQSQPSWDADIVPKQNIVEDVSRVNNGSLTGTTVNDLSAPVLIGIERLESTGQLAHKPAPSAAASVITEFDAESLPDELALSGEDGRYANGSDELESINTQRNLGDGMLNELGATSAASSLNATPIIPETEGYVNTPRSMTSYTKDTDLTGTEHHLQNKAISFGSAFYLRCSDAKNNIQYNKDNSLIIEKKPKKFLGGVFSKKKLNDQVFVIRENGYIESASNPDLVLTCTMNKGGIAVMAKKNPLDSSITQRWIARLNPDKKSYTLHCPIIPTMQLVRSSDLIGSKILLDEVESKWILKPF